MQQCHNPLEPSPQSLQHRARIAQLISPLRRVKPRVPFWQLAAHRIPTLWGLYRGLRKYADDKQIRWRIRKLFEKHRHQTGSQKTIECLKQGYKWLETFKRASQGDTKLKEVLTRYSRLIEAKREKEHWKQVLREEVEWLERLRTKPILTGSIQRASRDNRPLPRLYPQPKQFASMFIKRRRKRELRLARQRRHSEELQDLAREARFEEGLQREAGPAAVPTVFGRDASGEWQAPLRTTLKEIEVSFYRDEARLKAPITPEIVATAAKARAFKVANFTYLKEQQRKGLIIPYTLKRMRQGPPAHVLCKMTEKQKAMDRLVRMPSEGGYTGRMKRKIGVKLKSGDLWREEVKASEEGLARERVVMKENERRARECADLAGA
ncbi:hypothetical protein CC1G_04124 [Coprinopsis cinerea okayama7|uniref:Uncharacterized protein n=1 Tax=Coprinopsis cinerea (strain Okayama-7 / 130 / ATCC MYA-4618 / FGSC 9003) TaxID=240176 RepID=A8NW27_COPC7|nr:hypothetical protein CC1G_04124 [Coprinopsis cinerea okayama7\|eukprot:XP_001836811.1 hypothetical protein CC1G_04124 [Coprinopsis cinerea okayama7\